MLNPTDQSLFTNFIAGKQAGKRVNLFVDVTDANSLSQVPSIVMIEGRAEDDGAAQQLQLTLLPPKFIRGANAEECEAQRASGSVYLGSVGGLQAVPMIARLQWGTGGVGTGRQDDVEVDFACGLCVNLSCSFLRVSVSPDPLLSLLEVPQLSGGAYELQGFVSPGYPRQNNAQRTIRFRPVNGPDSIFTGSTPIVPIPRMATRWKLQVAPLDEQGPSSVQGWVAQVVFMSFDQNSMFVQNPDPTFWSLMESVVTVADNGNGNGQGFAIPNGATFVAVVHNNSFPIKPRLVFDLGI